jgi:hypothetical protein
MLTLSLWASRYGQSSSRLSRRAHCMSPDLPLGAAHVAIKACWFVLACVIAGYLANLAIGQYANAAIKGLPCGAGVCLFAAWFELGAPTPIYLSLLAFGYRYRVPQWAIIVGACLFFGAYLAIPGLGRLGAPIVFTPRFSDILGSSGGAVVFTLLPVLFTEALFRFARAADRESQ